MQPGETSGCPYLMAGLVLLSLKAPSCWIRFVLCPVAACMSTSCHVYLRDAVNTHPQCLSLQMPFMSCCACRSPAATGACHSTMNVIALLQVCGYLQILLSSINAPVVLEAAAGILALARVADRVLAAAPVLAIGALMDLWDHDSSTASHSQIMDIICANLDALQVRASLCMQIERYSCCLPA